jgi:hypothetical protein
MHLLASYNTVSEPEMKPTVLFLNIIVAEALP